MSPSEDGDLGHRGGRVSGRSRTCSALRPCSVLGPGVRRTNGRKWSRPLGALLASQFPLL